MEDKNNSNDKYKFDVFISYASENEEKAIRICKIMESKGLSCWIAPRNVRPGNDYPQEIMRGIEGSNFFLLLLSDAANRSKYVSKEVERAVSRDKQIFTVRIEEVVPSSSLELLISSTHWLDAFYDSVEERISLLVESILHSGDDSAFYHSSDTPANKNIVTIIKSNIVASVALLFIVLFGGISLFNLLGGTNNESTGDVLPYLLDLGVAGSLSELDKDDFFVTGHIQHTVDNPRLTISVRPVDTALMIARKATYTAILSDGTKLQGNVGTLLKNFNFYSDKIPESVSIRLDGQNGDSAGPFIYSLDFLISEMAEYKKKQDVRNQKDKIRGLKNDKERLVRGVDKGSLLGCRAFDDSIAGYSVCTLREYDSAELLISKILVGTNESNLNWSIDFGELSKISYAAFSTKNKSNNKTFLFAAKLPDLLYKVVYSDNTASGILRQRQSGYGRASLVVQFESKSENAPTLYATLNRWSSYKEGGSWDIVPAISSDVETIILSTYEGSAHQAKEQRGFLYFPRINGEEITEARSKTDGMPSVVTLKIAYVNGKTVSYEYSASVQDWLKASMLSAIKLEDSIHCGIGRNYGNGKIPNPTECSLRLNAPAKIMIKEIEWGENPNSLEPLEDDSSFFLVAEYNQWQLDNVTSRVNKIEAHDLPADLQNSKIKSLSDVKAKLDWLGSNYKKLKKSGSSNLQTAKSIYRQIDRNMEAFKIWRNEHYVDWRTIDSGKDGVILVTRSEAKTLYFKIYKTDGTATDVIRMPVKGK